MGKCKCDLIGWRLEPINPVKLHKNVTWGTRLCYNVSEIEVELNWFYLRLSFLIYTKTQKKNIENLSDGEFFCAKAAIKHVGRIDPRSGH